MADETTSRHTKVRELGETLWQLGLFSVVITGPIGASQGYSDAGLSGMLLGLTFGLAISGVIWLTGYFIVRALSHGDRHA